LDEYFYLNGRKIVKMPIDLSLSANFTSDIKANKTEAKFNANFTLKEKKKNGINEFLETNSINNYLQNSKKI
jgi:hypothetical protein